MSSGFGDGPGGILARALGDGRHLQGIVPFVCTGALLVGTTLWVMLALASTVTVTLLLLLGPLAAALTAVFVLRWAVGNDYDPAEVRNVWKWSAAGSVVLAFSGGLSLYVQYLHDHLQSIPMIQVLEWGCGGFVIGSVVGVYSTSRRARERQLRRERRKAENLAETLSVLNRVLRHDIRNNVNVIEGYVDQIAAEADADDHAAVVREHTGRIVQLAEYARETERLVSEGGESARTVDVVERLGAVCREVRAGFPEATVVTDFPERAEARAHRLVDSAFENLVTNAIEHHPADDPEIQVSVERDEDSVAVVVADDGPGIPDSEVSVLESGTESALEHSDGMGLWLVNWIVTYSGGDVEFAETDPTGSKVTVRLPAADC